ncbi:c-type cytochrome [Candidatus Glomeribacter gigasporarum]|uniref:c-type cytochrome n=1 Tax=Candidatus Glomeribacter gigasporarum TaxID=132144 RepID=UPI000311F017|nr:c-type cytochrome [Candidatus Glomeribacter gigasporarum]
MNKQRSEAASIKKIKLFIIAVIAGFLAPVLVLILLIQYVQTFSRTGAGSAAMSDAAIVQRLQPVAHVEIRAAQAEAANNATDAASHTAPETPLGEAEARAALASIAKTATQPHSRPSADTEQAGKALYEQICQACHASGLMGAPKQGDKAAWAPRLKESMETIYRYALKGKGNMPPKGGSNASDTDVKAAVDYMLKSVK